MEEQDALVAEWPYLTTLPAVYAGFSLQLSGAWQGAVRELFCYSNECGRRRITVVFDKATKDYMLRWDIGLHSYYDMNYIHPDRDKFEQSLAEGLERVLNLAQNPLAEGKNYLLNKKGIYDWQGYQQFPEQWHGFERFITPDRALPLPNGAYAILDYSDFQTGSQFLVLYNQLRNSLYAEKKLARTPVATTEFDAGELVALETRLKQGLEAHLLLMRQALAEKQA